MVPVRTLSPTSMPRTPRPSVRMMPMRRMRMVPPKGDFPPDGARLQLRVDDDAVVDLEPGLLRQRGRRTDADADDHEVAGEAAVVVELHGERAAVALGDRYRLATEMEGHAVLFVQRSDVRAE